MQGVLYSVPRAARRAPQPEKPALADLPPVHPDVVVRPDVQAFLDYLRQAAASGVPAMHEMPLDQARATYVAMQQLADLPPRPLAVIRDLACPGPAGDIPLRLYDSRESREPGPVLVFYHGGGFVLGGLDSHHHVCTDIAAQVDLPVIAVDYRLAPEHPFPAAPDDAEAAARWIAGSPDALGRTVTGLVPIGDSAGGNLAIVVTQALVAQPAAAPVIAQVPIYPLTDAVAGHASFHQFAEGFLLDAKVMQWFGEAYAAPDGAPRAFPLNSGHDQMPPTVLVTAGLDPIRDSGRVYGAALARAGSPLVFMERTGTIHGFIQVRKAIPSAQTDLDAILSGLRGVLDALRPTA